MSVQQLQDMCGIPQDMAAMYMEMAGNDLDQAVSLFFSLSESNSGNSEPTPTNEEHTPQSFFHIVWPSDVRKIPDSWLKQTIEFSGFGIIQKENGPCGVLSIIQGLLACQYFEKDDLTSLASLSAPDNKFVALVLAEIIRNCQPKNSESVKICKWENEIGDRVQEIDVKNDAVDLYFIENINHFMSEGGLVLLVYSAVLTHGEENVKKEIRIHGDDTLVTGRFHVCTTELMNLLLLGQANGNVGAYEADGEANRLFQKESVSKLGLASYAEIESGVPIADAFKFSRFPIWIIHGGDHFTLLFAIDSNTRNLITRQQQFRIQQGGLESSKDQFVLYHWNGLGVGQALTRVGIETSKKGFSSPASPHNAVKYFKPMKGEIEDVIQSHPQDKKAKPDLWTEWRYEVFQAVEDESVQGDDRPIDYVPQIVEAPEFDRTSSWRCASCYHTRFQTMCFGINEAGIETCQHCNKHQSQAGSSFYLRYSDLPQKFKKRVDSMYASKFINILWTLWPEAKITILDDARMPTV